MNQPQAALIYAPFPDAATARQIAAQLLEERLVACANIHTGVESVFMYEDAVQTAREVIVICKTTARQLDLAIARMAALHPYETPVIVGTVCDAAHPGTIEWLVEQTSKEIRSGPEQ